MNARLRTLRSLKNILELLAGEVRYGRAALPECCAHIARHLTDPYREAFLEIGRRMEENTGISFGEAFRSEMGGILAQLPLKEEDRENFLQFASQTGFADGQMHGAAGRNERASGKGKCGEEQDGGRTWRNGRIITDSDIMVMRV